MAKRRGGRVLVPGEGRARGGLILPGQPSPDERPRLLVPAEYADGPVTLVGKCHTCDATFYRGEEDEWQRHVGKCAREHLPEVMAAREEKKKRLEIFQPEAWDPEYEEHMLRVGKRMLAEGRLVTKPNER